MATCIVTDLIRPNEKKFPGQPLDEKSYKLVSKILSVLLGFLSIGFSYLFDKLGEGVLQV